MFSFGKFLVLLVLALISTVTAAAIEGKEVSLILKRDVPQGQNTAL
jgi:hypothetical protein